MMYIIECKKGEFGKWFHSGNIDTEGVFDSRGEAAEALVKGRKRFPHHDDGMHYRIIELRKEMW